MKQFTIIFMTLLLATASLAAKNNKYAQATFPKKSYDFGYIKESDGVVKCEFEFINTGTAPLLILETHVSCGCARPDYPKKPLMPGKKDRITVLFNPNGQPGGGFLKKVTIVTNGREKKTDLYLEGSIIPDKKPAH